MMKTIATMVASGVLASSTMATNVWAQGAPIEPEAIRALERMTDYLGGLKKFSLRTQNMLEEVLESGQKIQLDFSAEVLVERPDKLRADRAGDLVDQVVVYDGERLAIHDRGAGYYAVADAPDNLDNLLVFARDTLGLVPPSGDLIYSNAFELLTSPLTGAMVVGESMVGGVKCVHLAFRNPSVDWQVWIAEGDEPLPQKYVITTRSDPERPQYIVLMSDWNVSPRTEDSMFSFSAPRGAKQVDFLRLDSGRPSGH